MSVLRMLAALSPAAAAILVAISGCSAAESSTPAGGVTTTATSSQPSPPSVAAVTAASPPCAQAALQTAVNVGRPPDQRAVVQASDLSCDGEWAVVGATIPANREQVTVLLLWNAGNWGAVDRTAYCNVGRIPAGLRALACQSN
jgi:hypothetical protein